MELQSVLKGVVAFVEVRSGSDNRSLAISEELRKLGAVVEPTFTNAVTHVVFKEGLKRTWNTAVRRKVAIVSVSWIDSCKRNLMLMPEKSFPAVLPEEIVSPLPRMNYHPRWKKMKSMQPCDFDEELARSAERVERKRRRMEKFVMEDEDTPTLSSPVAPVLALDTQARHSPLMTSQASSPIPDTPSSMQQRLERMRKEQKQVLDDDTDKSPTAPSQLPTLKLIQKRLLDVFVNDMQGSETSSEEGEAQNVADIIRSLDSNSEGDSQPLKQNLMSSSANFMKSAEDCSTTGKNNLNLFRGAQVMPSPPSMDYKTIGINKEIHFPDHKPKTSKSFTSSLSANAPVELDNICARIQPVVTENTPVMKITGPSHKCMVQDQKRRTAPNKENKKRRSEVTPTGTFRSIRGRSSLSAALSPNRTNIDSSEPQTYHKRYDQLYLQSQAGKSLKLAHDTSCTVFKVQSPVRHMDSVSSTKIESPNFKDKENGRIVSTVSTIRPNDKNKEMNKCPKAEVDGYTGKVGNQVQGVVVGKMDVICEKGSKDQGLGISGALRAKKDPGVTDSVLVTTRRRSSLLCGKANFPKHADLGKSSEIKGLIIKNMKKKNGSELETSTDKEQVNQPKDRRRSSVTNNRASGRVSSFNNETCHDKLLVSSTGKHVRDSPEASRRNSDLAEHISLQNTCQLSSAVQSKVFCKTGDKTHTSVSELINSEKDCIEHKKQQTNRRSSQRLLLQSSVSHTFPSRIRCCDPPTSKESSLCKEKDKCESSLEHKVTPCLINGHPSIDTTNAAASLKFMRAKKKRALLSDDTTSLFISAPTVDKSNEQAGLKARIGTGSERSDLKSDISFLFQAGTNTRRGKQPKRELNQSPASEQEQDLSQSSTPLKGDIIVTTDISHDGCGLGESHLKNEMSMSLAYGNDTTLSCTRTSRKSLEDFHLVSIHKKLKISKARLPKAKHSTLSNVTPQQNETEKRKLKLKSNKIIRNKRSRTSSHSSSPGVAAKKQDPGNVSSGSGADSTLNDSNSSSHPDGDMAPRLRHAQSLLMEHKFQPPSMRSSYSLVMTSLHRDEQEIVCAIVKKLGVFHMTNNVQASSTHVVCGGARRTLNVLKGIASGCWLLKKDWVLESLEAGHWIPEEPFEISDFPAAVKSRIERHGIGPGYKVDLFSKIGPIYVSSACTPPRKEIVHLITLCSGHVTGSETRASVHLGDEYNPARLVVKPVWVLDCIMKLEVLPKDDYFVSPKIPSSQREGSPEY